MELQSMLVIFFMAVTKYLGNNLKKEGFILASSFRG
jgi:hypothetical protein